MKAKKIWEGYITSVKAKDDYFTAILIDIAGQSPDIEVEIGFDNVKEKDRKLIKLGAYFYLSTSFVKKPKLCINFRRDRWTAKEIKAAKLRTTELQNYLGTDS